MKRKGTTPQFNKQRSTNQYSADNQAGPSNRRKHTPTSQKTLLMRVGLPPIGKKTDTKGKGKAKGKSKAKKARIADDDDEDQVSWDTDNEIEAWTRKRPGPYDFMDGYASQEPASLESIRVEDPAPYDWINDAYQHYGPDIMMDPPDEDPISPQVSFLTFGLIGSLIIKQEQFWMNSNGPLDSVDSSICNFINNSSLNCSECKKCKESDPMWNTQDLLKKVLRDDDIEFIRDSGASATFTYSLDDFITVRPGGWEKTTLKVGMS